MNHPKEHLESHVPVERPDQSPVDLLQQATGLSKRQIKTAMTRGAVWITRGRSTRRLRRVKRALQTGDELHIYYDAAILAETPPQPELVADTGAYTVWNKPRGLRSQGSKWGDHCTVVRWAERHLEPERPAFTVHRLDRAAAGLMLLAHSKKVAAALSALFRERKITKGYRAVVTGDLSERPGPIRMEQAIDGRAALSEFTFVELLDEGRRSVVDVRIETGRKHQIRRHLADLGHPIVGDRLYGAGAADGADLQLTACLLAFHCPVQDAPVEYRLAGDLLPGTKKATS
jgi:tRNA pseudouridine32 synthase/23S rRNA pseudouridine746 synthase